MPISRLATESRPSQAQCSSWQLPLNGRAVPALPCAGKLPSHRPPVLYHRACAIPACRRRASHVDAPLRARLPQFESRITSHESRLCYTTVPARFQLAADAPVMSTRPCVRGSRSSNHESRVTNHACVIPPCLRDSSLPPTRQSCRRAPACAAPAVRITNHESRITPVLYHRACAIPACRRRASRVDAPLPARFQLAADAPVMSTPPCVRGSRSSNHESRVTNHACVIPPCLRDSSSPPTRQSCRRHRACAAPAVRITNHESRITPVLCHRACAILACRRRASHVDAPLRARLPQFESRITSHESRLCYTTVPARPQPVAVAPRTRSHRTCASPTRSQFDPRPPLPPGTGH